MASRETSTTGTHPSPPTRAKKVVYFAVLIAIGFAILLAVAEPVSRDLLPIPGAELGLLILGAQAAWLSQVFYDHVTPLGHVATANSFKAWLEQSKSYGRR